MAEDEGPGQIVSDTAQSLRARLRDLGLSRAAIDAAWPSWWDGDAGASPSARAELTFSVARRLGIDPRTLIGDASQAPAFLWSSGAQFKHLAAEEPLELAGINSFGRAVAQLLLRAAPRAPAALPGLSARDLRAEILVTRPFVDLVDLLSVGWALGIPVVHLRVFPWRQKRMASMAVRIGDRSVVLLGKDALYPAPIAFYLAHELGHIALGQLEGDGAIVDLEDREPRLGTGDASERAADAFALELLTGDPRFRVLPADPTRYTARELARTARASALSLRIEPGVLAQCFGFATGHWGTATAALRMIYDVPRPMWQSINRTARQQLAVEELPADGAEFVDAILGLQPG